jgi:hypothetical protein
MPLFEGLTCCKERDQLTRWSKTDEKSVAEIKLAKIKLYYFANPPSKNRELYRVRTKNPH